MSGVSLAYMDLWHRNQGTGFSFDDTISVLDKMEQELDMT